MGKKSTFRLLNRGSAKALDKVVELDGIRTGPLVTNISFLLENTKYIQILQNQGRKS